MAGERAVADKKAVPVEAFSNEVKVCAHAGLHLI
jgi:hypothetical protein